MKNNIETESISLPALQAGDQVEFTRLVEATYEMIYRLALKMLDNSQDAEDILQETYLKAYRALPSFDGRSSISTWLYRIATNETLMFLRRKRPETISVDEPLELEDGTLEPVEIVDWCCLPETELMSAEVKRTLDQAVQTLSPALRAVFVLRDLQGLSTSETGEVLNLSEVAVKTRLSRARLQLREMLSGYFRERMKEGKISNGT